MRISWIYAACAAFSLPLAAQAQDPPVYKCAGKGEITYSHVPCPGAKVVGETPPKPAASREVVSSDRAKLHARAQLPPDVRQQCSELDGKIHDEQEALKAKGEGVTPAEEGVLVRLRIKAKELGC